MLIKWLKKIFSTYNDRVLKKTQKIVDSINSIEHEFVKLTDEQLRNKTNKFRNQLFNGKSIDSILPEAFATVREGIKRVFGLRLFNVQLLGGIILHQSCIAEMATGEGKTLTATLPAYLNSLCGKGVHIVTMNDYLAKRDATQNALLFNFLDVTVGLNLSGLSLKLKKQAYNANITYGTNNEYGFDYLRDNMVYDADHRVQRSLYYALIDEVDSILIDESRTPLVISTGSENNSRLYFKINQLVSYFKSQSVEDTETYKGSGDFYIDEKQRQVHFTERGFIKTEKLLTKNKLMKDNESLYSFNNIVLMNCMLSALRAHKLFVKDVDYIVKEGKIIIIDEHTGRLMKGRRWSDGIHQAIEAKENVEIKEENQILASITFQNYFKLYKKLSGMTGTAITESFEFNQIYNLNTVKIPTNRPMIRKDLPDLIYMTEEEKIKSVIKDIKECISKGQPVLVGTISIEKSETISRKLDELGITHNVLNAKIHDKEAQIISDAGKLGSVTIATNMAGRGTDIVLGGSIKNFKNKKDMKNVDDKWIKEHSRVLSVGGLHIIGTERHESRRIDNQLRGRSGRQGDCGSSRFYLSMEDSLMRIFLSRNIINIMKKIGIKENESIQHKWITKAISNAQKKVENRNFDIRKNLLDYDNIANDQRRIIYEKRNELINANNVSELIFNMLKDVFFVVVNNHITNNISKNKKCLYILEKYVKDTFKIKIAITKWTENYDSLSKDKITKCLIKQFNIYYQQKIQKIGIVNIKKLEKLVMIESLDVLWKEHLSAMDYLRNGIYLRSYAQKDPKQEYKKESFIMFSKMLERLKHKVIVKLCSMIISSDANKKNLYNM